jgi:hypothetical protein
MLDSHRRELFWGQGEPILVHELGEPALAYIGADAFGTSVDGGKTAGNEQEQQ